MGKKYADDAVWADVTPLPTDEGGSHPLAAIAYSEEYEETMSYLRAVMAANEYSERALELTDDLIDMNPAHYTVWGYRAQILFALGADLREERAWLNDIALAHQKNYQIWHHRHLIVDRLGDATGETAFVEKMFALDAKNYHVWSYRQWLVERFALWHDDDDGDDKAGGGTELAFTERMLAQDVRNNSAWNHRWFLVHGRAPAVPGVTDPGVRAREWAFATAAIRPAPQNPSPWNYLRGIVRESGAPLRELKALAEEYADMASPGGVRSSHALHLLADVLAAEAEDGDEAGRARGRARARQALDLLAGTYDPIRKNYWEYRKGLLGPSSVEAQTAAA